MKNSEIKSTLSLLPENPGVYYYIDSQGTIIYIGKAKNLKKRVSSYFQKNHDNAKVRILVRKIETIKTIIVESETDALLLENNLIKKHKPKYNILLKDDKTYPWICVKNEPFPRVFSTRTIYKDGSEYFGPYTSIKMVKTILNFIHEVYKLRTCSLNLSTKSISENKHKVCLNYHIGNCLGPCQNFQSESNYNANIKAIKNILKGNIKEVIAYLEEQMNVLSKDYKFEEANIVKQKIELLKSYQSKSTIVSQSIHNVDVFTIYNKDSYAYVNFLKIVNGSIIQSHTVEIKKLLNETDEDILQFAITDIQKRFFSTSDEIITSCKISYPNKNIVIPKIGDKKKLVELSLRNAMYYARSRAEMFDKSNPVSKLNSLMETMKKDLRLTELPIHIEGFDNSNIQGSNPVSSCVVFKNGKPSKKEYRKFNVKTVFGPNDFDSMTEVIYRRYKRLVAENQSLPQLILIDGGKGQLHAAIKALDKLKLTDKIAIIGIAKKLEEIYYPNDSVPLYLDKNSPTLRVLQHVRNESHRFGITFHKDQRSKDFIKSELDNIKGIGEKTKVQLFQEFKTIATIKEQNIETLSALIGKSKALIITNYFSNK